MNIGTNTVDKVYLGSSEVDRIYVGSTIVYQRNIAIYQGANPSDPNNEQSDVSMMVPATNHTFSVSSTRSTVGTISTRLVTTATGDSNIPLTGTVNGVSYTVSMDVYSTNVTGATAAYVWLDPTRGWSGADVDGVTYDAIPVTPGWNTITLTATTSQNDAPMWLSVASGNTIELDNIVVTQN